jgi:pimeloyl-ACP methyl ester carboxylesterase
MTIRDFTIGVPQDDLIDLHRRLESTRWPPSQRGVRWQQGTDVTWLRNLCDYWSRGFDWRTQESFLNTFPQKMVTVDGLDIHCIVSPGRGPSPRPLVLTHGWPSTFFEFYKVIGPLSDPAAFGGDPSDAFDVIVPSLPGYGFSEAPPDPGTGINQIADLWVQLVQELGYKRFFAHGGDWGAAVTGALATRHPEQMLGVHLTMLSPPIDAAALKPEHRDWWDHLQRYRDQEWGYVHLQRTKPQTAAFALTDSPAGLAAWILEKWWRWSDCAGENGERDPLLVYTRDELLTVTSLYWFTESIGPSMRLYYESFGPGSTYRVPSRIEVPTGVSIFRDPNAPPRDLIEPWCDLRHYATFDRGGHFPALENPDAVVSELRTFSRTIR